MRISPQIIAVSFTAFSLVAISACGGSESDRDEPKIKNVAISNTTVNAGPTSSYATGLNKSPMPTSAVPMIPQTTATTAPANNQNVVNMGPTTSYATGLNKSPMPTSALPMIPQTTAVQKATPTSVFTATTTTKALAKPAASNSTVAPKVTTKPKSTTTTVAKKTTKKKKTTK